MSFRECRSTCIGLESLCTCIIYRVIFQIVLQAINVGAIQDNLLSSDTSKAKSSAFLRVPLKSLLCQIMRFILAPAQVYYVPKLKSHFNAKKVHSTFTLTKGTKILLMNSKYLCSSFYSLSKENFFLKHLEKRKKILLFKWKFEFKLKFLGLGWRFFKNLNSWSISGFPGQFFKTYWSKIF